MSNFTEAADTIKRIAFQYQGILELGQHLEQIGSLESAMAGWKTQHDQAYAAAVRAKADLADLRAQIDQETARGESLLKTRLALLEDKTHAARLQATEIVQQAQDKATAILAAERAQRESAIVDLVASRAAVQADLAGLHAQVTQAKADLEAVQAHLTSAQADLDTIRGVAKRMVA
jgi:chromosome segregation ATPase